LHRSDGWVSIRHLWTFLTELAFALVVFLLSKRIFDGVTIRQAFVDAVNQTESDTTTETACE
jgi:hypothetical protein